MKHVCITYHMNKKFDTAETCITLPMSDWCAEDLIENEIDSRLYELEIHGILQSLAHIQGYRAARFVSAELEKRLEDLEQE